eukprot:3937781-Rhodomonas_salina.4
MHAIVPLRLDGTDASSTGNGTGFPRTLPSINPQHRILAMPCETILAQSWKVDAEQMRIRAREQARQRKRERRARCLEFGTAIFIR